MGKIEKLGMLEKAQVALSNKTPMNIPDHFVWTGAHPVFSIWSMMIDVLPDMIMLEFNIGIVRIPWEKQTILDNNR